MGLLFIEYTSRLFLKMKIFIHKSVNWGLYSNGVKLYGIPKLLHRQNIKIESGVNINEGVFLHGAGYIYIGGNSTLSYGTTILSSSYDVSKWNEKCIKTPHVENSVIIGRKVWLCSNVIVLDGVEIADGVIVGAGSVVNKSITTPNSLYAGVPAKFIKKL